MEIKLATMQDAKGILSLLKANHVSSLTEEEQKEYLSYPSLHQTNTSKADYVWLPLLLEDNSIRIRWQQEWRWEDLVLR